MARALRSGRKIKSVSPVKKDVRDISKKAAIPAKKAPAKTAAAVPQARGKAAPPTKAAAKAPVKKGGKNVAAAPAKRGGRQAPKKEEAESEEEEEEIEESEGESEEVSDDDDDDDESESESEEENVKTPPKAKTNAKGKVNSAEGKKQIKNARKEEQEEEDESESEESESEVADMNDDSEGESDESDEVDKVIPTPIKKAKSPMKKSPAKEESEEESSDGEDDDDESEEDKGFTDENAKWLKKKTTPTKQKLMSSSDEEDDKDGDEFGMEEEESDEEMLEVERQSRLIDKEMEHEQEDAEIELRRTIAQQTSIFHLPTPEELEDDANRVVPPSELRARIEDVLEVLADFKTRREPDRSRSEYIERLAQDMAELFGYLQELVDYFLSMFGPNETLEFLEASDKPRPLVVRVNTLKARRKDLAAALMKRGVRLDPLAPWSKVGLKIYESTVPIGATPEYLAGHYMLQSAASMCPVMALGPQPGDRVLDMSAAPGGKTTYLAQLMRNKGVVIANDLKPERQKATVANLHRLGVRNVVSCVYDGRKLGAQMRNSFDRILLDAPCSGLGVISRDPSVKVQRTIPDVHRCAHLQKELLLAAIDALNHKSKKGGGFMVYSTCSIAVAENEEVVNYLLAKRDVKIVDAGLDFGKSPSDFAFVSSFNAFSAGSNQ